ncbi:hypothetical protein BDP27DRAFT_1235073 [Rhodocollybia butyracea]|uniref:Uncharacterized protein n=1 Tax=Rhodocollybia butyracea TaxID=206335 RepID=A0A9P5U1F8_9AGAR|nr:hypothetical protein BDP27DRAFT_1235073 [Rhodocollybia butyracea]
METQDSKILAFLAKHLPDTAPDHSLSNFKSWVVQSRSYISRVVRDPVEAQATSTQKVRNQRKKKLVKQLLLNTHNDCINTAIGKLQKLIPTHVVKRKVVPYPPSNYWIVESQEIWDLWRYRITTAPQPDACIRRKPMHMVDESKLAYDVHGKESAIFVDEKKNPVAVVISELCDSEEILFWANEIVLLNVALERNVRKEDAGSIVISGWSAGSRSRMHLDFARNLKSKSKLSALEKHELQYKSASVFALFWNLVKSFGPKEVVEDLEEFVKENDLYRMDTSYVQNRKSQTYTIDVGDGVPVTFHNTDLAPPSGVFARNYARCVCSVYISGFLIVNRPVHYEKQPHKWAASWTTYRDNTRSQMGGHFYLASYGIRIQGASNRAVFWRLADWHGTSLPNLEPSEKEGPLLQSGLAIVTLARLPAAFRRFHKGQLSAEELHAEISNQCDELGLEEAMKDFAL